MESVGNLQLFAITEFKCALLIIKSVFLQHLPCDYKEKSMCVNYVIESNKNPTGRVGPTVSSFHTLHDYSSYNLPQWKKKFLTQGTIFI